MAELVDDQVATGAFAYFPGAPTTPDPPATGAASAVGEADDEDEDDDEGVQASAPQVDK